MKIDIYKEFRLGIEGTQREKRELEERKNTDFVNWRNSNLDSVGWKNEDASKSINFGKSGLLGTPSSNNCIKKDSVRFD